MDLPAEVLIHNASLEMKGRRGTLLRISSDGYYELNAAFGEVHHRVFLPISSTALFSQKPEEKFEQGEEIEH